MKILISILLFSAAFTAACSKIENFTNLTQQKIESETLEDQQPDAPPILEITQHAKGMFDVTGRTLFFNLYDNGVIEFEFADDKKKTAGKTNKAEEVNTLKRAKVSAGELKKFTDLLKSEDFHNTRNDYKKKCCCTDATLDYQINFSGGEQKNISLSSYCDLGELMNAPTRKTSDIPKILSDLLTLVYNTRQNNLSE